MKKQVYALCLLASVSISVLASCQTQNQPADTGRSETEAASVTVPAEPAETEDPLKSLLPDDLDFEGRTIRVCNSLWLENDAFMFNAEEATGDVVNDAVYEARLKVETDLNVSFTSEDIVITRNEQDPAMVIRKSVQAGSDDYDMIFGIQYNIAREVLNNLFVNLAGSEYLHLDQPWWYDKYMKELSVSAEKIYFLAGDISLGVLRNMSCMYVNKKLYQQYFEDPADIYREVLDGKWTIDRLAEQCTEMYQDLNGDGKRDAEDRYGIGVITLNQADHLTYDSGIRVTARDENNLPYLNMNTEKTVNFMEKLYQLYYENPGTFIFEGNQDSIDIIMPNQFNQDALLYLPGWFYTAELMRNMDVEYAVIPYPKCDENEPTYHSLPHDVSTIACVPTTCQIPEAVTACMEALAFEGYKKVLPAYYEIATKIKYTRDSSDEAMQVLDLIHDNATTDFAYIYNRALSEIGMIPRLMLMANSRDFVSFYTRREKSAEKKLNKLIDIFTSLD